jgi:hypothetical protein
MMWRWFVANGLKGERFLLSIESFVLCMAYCGLSQPTLTTTRIVTVAMFS